MTTLDSPASLTVRTLIGPSRPVRVIRVTGELDQSNQIELLARLQVARSPWETPGPGRRSVAAGESSTAVVDLRAAGFVAAGALSRLHDHARHQQQPVRLLLDPTTAKSRVLHRIVEGLGLDLEIHHDLVAAARPGLALRD